MGEELDFVFGGDTTVEEFVGPTISDEEKAEKEEKVEKVEEPKEKEEEVKEEKPDEETETEEKPAPKDNRAIALSNERARRKQAEKELRELKSKIEAEKNRKEDEDKLQKQKDELKQELLKGDLVDEDVADKLISTFGDRLLKSQIENERKTAEEDFERKFSELTSGEFFKDADDYKEEIRELVGKGLTLEQAYRAAIPQGRFEQMRKDMEIEAEQKLLYSQEKADKVDVGHTESKDEVKKTTYTKREQEIARETGLDIKDVHKRSKMFTLDEILDL